MIAFNNLEHILSGETKALAFDRPITDLVIDSRKPILAPGALFIAIKGERHDAHQYLQEIYDLGIRQFVVQEADQQFCSLPHINVVKVKDSIAALQTLASHHRDQFEKTVIGVTGSNGKTIVKEWLSELLNSKFNVIKSPKSYNSQVGVPLSVWGLQSTHDMAVFEAGISEIGEMEKLQKIIRPKIGIFTNVGTAHDEGFHSKKEKVMEKLKLFSNSEAIIYCRDYDLIHDSIKEIEFSGDIIDWSFNQRATFSLDVEFSLNSTLIIYPYEGTKESLEIPFTDHASIENICHILVTLILLGYKSHEIRSGINDLKKINMRLELKQGINNCSIVDDSYNNDLGGLRIALNFLEQQKAHEKRTLFLSDILQSGESDIDLYAKVAQTIQDQKIDHFIGVGAGLQECARFFNSSNSTFYPNTEDLLKNLNINDFNNELILIKGARPFGFEKIVEKLQQKVHGTILEINLDALTHNLNFYRSKIKPDIKLMVMVKAFAYGSGSDEVAHLLQYNRVDYLTVAYADEGVSLRNSGIRLPIMVMNPSEETFQALLDYDLEPEIYSLNLLRTFCSFLKANGKESKIHLKLDTGMNRLGFSEDDIEELLILLSKNNSVEIESIFSHLAGADESSHNEFSHEQAEAFKKMSNWIIENLSTRPTLHLLNSAGILRFPEYHFDMVRLGIGLYGLEANNKEQNQLMPISKWKTNISQIKTVMPGETIGYSRKGRAKEKMEIATIAIGYADGFGRVYGNGNAEVLIGGQRVPTIGNICMDMTMVDVTGISASEGDEVIIFGDGISPSELATKSGTIAYEILTNVSDRVKRVFYSE